MDIKKVFKNSAVFITKYTLNFSDKILQKKILCVECGNYAIPYYKCPKCGLVYKKLNSKDNELFYKRCNKCNEKLPTSILGGKNNLILVCSKCGSVIDKNFNPFIIVLFGDIIDETKIFRTFTKKGEFLYNDSFVIFKGKNNNLDYLNSQSILSLTKGGIFVIDDVQKAENNLNTLITALHKHKNKTDFIFPLAIVFKNDVKNPKDYLYDSAILNLLKKFKNYKFFNMSLIDETHILEFMKRV